MNGLPWSNAYGNVHPEIGGADELQTDVMRFMAILALCLVAIFALVRSMPLRAPVERVAEPPPVMPVVEPEQPAAAAPKPQMREAAAPEPVAESPAEPVPESVARPVIEARPVPSIPEPATAAPAPATRLSEPAPKPVQLAARPVEPPPPQQEPVEGFTLRFESDAVLAALVAQGRVELFAIEQGQSWQLWSRAGQVGFETRDAPRTLHLMTPASVPAEVRQALERDVGLRAASVEVWGVTLPAAIRRQLDSILSTSRGGALVIGAGGSVNLQRRTGS